MEHSLGERTTSIRFAGSVLAVSVLVFVIVARLASPASTVPRTTLSPVEVRALAQQATLRVAASECGSLTRGSGVIVDGRLITNAHVVEGASEVKADQPIDPVVLPVIAADARSDLAAAEQPVGVSLLLAAAETVQNDIIAGSAVTLAGHADGGRIEIQGGTVTARVPGGAYGYGVDVLLIDAPTRGGYSGGPVLNDSGDVVALLSGFDRTTGLTVAIPADVIADFLAGVERRASPDADRAVVGCVTG